MPRAGQDSWGDDMQLIVLGMHRSGTSMLMRLLNLMGAYFGPEGVSTGANAENPRGFWERRDIRSLNDALLWSKGRDWNRISGLDLARIPAATLSGFRKKAERLVLEMDAHRPWAIKEPRLCLLLPIWRELFQVPVLIHIHRHPAEVASSLEKRNGVPRDAGLALWEGYVVAAHRNGEGLPSVRISHRRLIDDPVGSARSLFEALGALGVQGLRLPAEREITRFISQDLYRERASRADLQTLSAGPHMRLFEMLEAGEPSAAIAAWSIETASKDALAAYEATLPPPPKESPAPAPTSPAPDQVKRIETEVGFLREIATKLASDLKDRDEGVRGLEWEIRTIRGDIEQRASELAWRDRRSEELQEQLDAKDALIKLNEENLCERDLRLRAHEDDLRELRDEHKRLSLDLAHRDRRSLELEEQVKERDALVSLREAEAKSREQRIRSLEDELREANAAARELTAEVQQRERRILEQQETLATKSALKAEYKALAEQRDQLVRSLENSIREAGEEAILRAQDIAQRDHRIGELQEQLSAMELRLQRREAEASRLQALAGTLQTALDRARKESAEREELVVRQSRELLDVRAGIEGHEKEARGRQADIERLSGTIKELEAARTMAEDTIAERFRETEQLTRMLMEKEDEIGKLRQALSDLESTIAALSGKTEELDTARATAENKLAERFRETEQLTRLLMEEEDEVRKLVQDLVAIKAALQERDKKIAMLEPLQATLDARALECRKLEERSKWLRDRLRSLETSTSWKVTAPFRNVVSVVRGGRRRGGASKSDIERIRSSALFDAAWYLSSYPDVGESGQDPAAHYLVHGGLEGRNPGPGFDSRRYLSLHQDVMASGINPLLHYVLYGMAEGRSIGGAAAIPQSKKTEWANSRS